MYRQSFFGGSQDVLADDSVDLVITSPPHMNNYHYVRNTHPQLFWLDFISNASDLKPLEDANYGRYWQSVGDGEPVQLSFDREFVLVAQPPFRGRQSIAATTGRQAKRFS